jgi:hypothetical protein
LERVVVAANAPRMRWIGTNIVPDGPYFVIPAQAATTASAAAAEQQQQYLHHHHDPPPHQ